MFTGQVDMVRMVPSCETQTAPTNTKSHMSFRRTFSSERFIKPAINASVPILMANDPSESSMCGGLTIFTSSPYALCHQLSNGAEVRDRKSTRLNSSHLVISYAVFCLKQ